MKRIIALIMVIGVLFLTACDAVSIGIIGGADGPTNITVSENNYKKTFMEKYVNERKLPALDIHIENPFVSDDRTLILDDTIENNLELMIYEYYRNLMSGSYQEAKEIIADDSLLAATEAHENNFKQGIYYSQIFLDDVELADRDDLDEISDNNKQAIVAKLNELNVSEFGIVKVEKTIKHNELSLSLVPQVGDGEVTRYFLLGKINNDYKIIEVYWEGFMMD